jgi:hypothetical protein
MAAPRSLWLCVIAAGIFSLCCLTNCANPEPRPAGVGRGISFTVTPLLPKGYEIVAFGSRLRDEAELKDAWQKKAKMVANGRRYKSSPLVTHKNESDYYSGSGVPLLTRSVSGTITLLD